MNEMPEVGQRVQIVGDHVWAGHTGTVLGYETLGRTGQLIGVIELDKPAGQRAGFFDQREVEPLRIEKITDSRKA